MLTLILSLQNVYMEQTYSSLQATNGVYILTLTI